MCTLTFAALLGFSTSCAAIAPANLLAPGDSSLETRFHPPPSPLAGLKRYQPVEARNDWGTKTLPASIHDGGKTGGNVGAMPGMKGMDMPGMDMGGTR